MLQMAHIHIALTYMYYDIALKQTHITNDIPFNRLDVRSQFLYLCLRA